MGSSGRKGVTLVIIVAMHGAGIIGLMNAKRTMDPVVAYAPLSVRAIAEREMPRESVRPIEVKLSPTQVHLEPPIQIDFDTPMPESSRAITIPAQAMAPAAVAQVDRSVPKLIESVEYVREPMPRYPPQSRRLREEGLVMLRVLIDERGVACSIEVESSSGFVRLDRAARDAVEQASFRPYVEDGAPRRAVVLIPIEFSLARTAA